MLTRGLSRVGRAWLAGLCALSLIAAVAPRIAFAASSPEDTIRSFYETLQSTMKDGAKLGVRGRYEQLRPAIQQNFDLTYMTHLAVGAAWNKLTEEQRKQASDAFARYITATYADNFASYSGEKFVVTGQQKTSYGTVVESQIVRSSGEPVIMNYLMRQNDGDWRIADIYLTGTISQLATLRSQFSSVVAREGFAGLITLLNSKAQALTAAPAAATRPPACSCQSAQGPL